MLGAGHRMRVVVPEVHATVRLPLRKDVRGRELAVGTEHSWKIPVEHPDVEPAPAARQVVQEVPDFRLRIARVQEGAAVEIPREQRDGALGPLCRLPEGREISRPVDHESNAAGLSHLAAVRAFVEKTRGVRMVGRFHWSGRCEIRARG